MSTQKENCGGLEWRLTVSDGSSEALAPDRSKIYRVWLWVHGLAITLKLMIWNSIEKIWKLGADDPRRAVHGLKVGIALSVVSLFYYVRPLYNGIGGTAMWAVMTVVVVFEFSVGATLSKGLNRGMATLLAGSLALGVHSVASQFGEKTEPVVLVIAVFLTASSATFSRFIPTIKRRFDYGITIFILTFSLVTVSGFRVEKLVEMAHQRLSTIAIGGSMCMIVSMLVFPVWAGEDLHLLITRNIEKLGDSLHGSMVEYFSEGEDDTGDDEPCKKLQAYKCVLNSKATEESLANFARWEPAHGQFGFWHPWKQYLKIGTTLRYCACCIEALNASINSEIKAPESAKKYLSVTCSKLSSQCSSVLKELARTTKTMTKSSSIDFSVEEMKSTVEDLRNTLKSLPDHLTHQQEQTPQLEAKEEAMQPLSTTVPLFEVLPLVTISSLLLEIAARVEAVVSAIEELADLASFNLANDEKPKKNQPVSNLPPKQQEQDDAVRAIQLV
ncbi:aluminum-activated malate transporter 10-like [Aristolochia californica]|uniref:aluminum-activated malate transporter 10-like n=1 Tax=Aristolochia californica TaxID=171875 RepID=UPI0035E27F85